MAIIKHIAMKSGNYTGAIHYLLFQHDEFTQEEIVDEYGVPVLREEYYFDGINCEPYAFDYECADLNRKFHKNNSRGEIKQHHYIISFDPKDVTECGLTGEKAQSLGMEYAKENFPGHQMIICTHTDGHNKSGNIHVHIVMNSLRKNDVDMKPFMEREIDGKAGYKHHVTPKLLIHLKESLMSLCQREQLHQVDLLRPPKKRITKKEYYASRRAKEIVGNNGQTKFESQKDYLRKAIEDCARKSKNENTFRILLMEKYSVTLTISRGRYGYIHPDRSKPIRGGFLMDILKQYAGIPDTMIFDSLCKADSIINRKDFRHICASISGGSDSDIVLDICHKIDIGRQIRYSWFDTGLEYAATKEHLKFLESRYSISINRAKAVIPVPGCCHKYGVPFLSKQVSENIERLQRHHFQWEDAPYEYLTEKYPQCLASIKWWCNRYDKAEYPGHSIFSIGRNKGLKEFLVRHPPRFPISSKCCLYSKKCTAAGIDAANRTDLSILGIRRAEGGIRSAAYKGCFSTLRHTGISEYRPLFWYTTETKRIYEECFDIVHSRCYLEYGMTRTGCAGCPYNRKILEELPVNKRLNSWVLTSLSFTTIVSLPLISSTSIQVISSSLPKERKSVSFITSSNSSAWNG